MANILMITFDVSDRAALDIHDALINFGHAVTILSQSEAESDNSLLSGYELIVCPRLSCLSNSASMLQDALNLGTPVISGTYTGIPNNQVMSDSYKNNVLETYLNYTSTIKSNDGNGDKINIPLNKADFFYYLNIKTSKNKKVNTPIGITNTGTFIYSYDIPKSPLDSYWSLEGRSVIMINAAGADGAKLVSYGALYGRTTFTEVGLSIIESLVNIALSKESANTITGKVTLEEQPHSSKVVVTSVNQNPVVLGFGESDINGDYSINVGEYSGTVLIHTMQDYGDAWKVSAAKIIGDVVHPTTPNGYIYKVTKAGNTGQNEPTWTADQNVSINDGSVIYQSERLLKPEIEGYVTPKPVS